MVQFLPPICVTLRGVADLPTPVAIGRRGRTTAVVVRAGLSRRQVREALGDALRPAELALIRRSMKEPVESDALPPDLDSAVVFPGQLLVCHRDSMPVAYNLRFG